MAVLALRRDLSAYLDRQRQQVWKTRDFVWADQRRVGTLGMGELGRAAGEGSSGFAPMGTLSGALPGP